MIQFIVGEKVDEVFPTTKTEEMAQKASQKLRVVTYHAGSIRDHLTLDNLKTYVLIKKYTVYLSMLSLKSQQSTSRPTL